MATRRYSLTRGNTDKDVVEAVGAATVSGSMEFTFDLAANLTRNEVELALDVFKRYILKGNFPPA